MKSCPQVQCRFFGAIPGSDDNAGAETGHANRLIKCFGVAGQFINEIRVFMTTAGFAHRGEFILQIGR